MKFDLKSVIVGLVLGSILILAFGAVETRDFPVKWGLIVPSGSKVLVRDIERKAFIVDVDSGQAVRVEHDPTKTAASKVQLTLGARD